MAEPKTIYPQFQAQEAAIASYDYFDIAEGTGIKQFYGIVSNLSSGNVFYMTDKTINSSLIESTSTGTTALTFTSLPFNFPKTVKGSAFFVCAFIMVSGGGSADVSIKYQHWDGSTATDISSTITSAGYVTAGDVKKPTYLVVPLTQTHFKAGDMLRAIVTIHTTTSTIYVGHSPTNQTAPSGYTGDTQMIFGIPFRIET